MSLLTYSFLLDILILTAAFVIAIHAYFTWDFNYWKKRNVPFIPPTAIVGNLGGLITGRLTIYQVFNNAYKQKADADFCGIFVFGRPALVLRSPQIIKLLLVKDFNNFNDRSITSDSNADPLSAHFLFVAKNPLWRSLRTKTSPVFTSSKIKNMVPLINANAKDFMMYLFENAVHGPIDSRELCAKFTTDVITSCAFGLNANSFKYEDAEFRKVGRQMIDFTFLNALRALSYFLAPRLVTAFKMPLFQKSIIDFLTDAFSHAFAERKRSAKKRNDFIDIVMEMLETDEFENNIALAQAIQFFAAGFETTASTISYSLFELASNQKYQSQLREELKDVAAGGCELNFETIKHFTFLDQVISETLRKYPVLPFLDRQCIHDYQVPNCDLVIDKGTNIYIPIMALHYDEQYFPNPEKFNPHRFNEENSQNIPPYSYLPFGIGPRNCVGERFGLITSKLGLIHVITNFKVEVCEKTPTKIIFTSKSFLLQPIGGIYLKFTPM